MKQRLAGLVLFAMLALVAVPGLVLLPLLILFGPVDAARRALRGLDMFGNSAVFGGSPYESISSHVGREMRSVEPVPWWALMLDALLDLIQAGHCEEANRREQPIVDAVESARRG